VPIYALDYAAPSIDLQAYVHPDAVVIGSVELAAGASVWPGAVLRGDHGLIRVGERTSVRERRRPHGPATVRCSPGHAGDHSPCAPGGKRQPLDVPDQRCGSQAG
jgi:carbonic anhydrase/acetyltransferase-like protein (isoleucine patch superfamily)